jgi:hypothetical protein
MGWEVSGTARTARHSSTPLPSSLAWVSSPNRSPSTTPAGSSVRSSFSSSPSSQTTPQRSLHESSTPTRACARILTSPERHSGAEVLSSSTACELLPLPFLSMAYWNADADGAGVGSAGSVWSSFPSRSLSSFSLETPSPLSSLSSPRTSTSSSASLCSSFIFFSPHGSSPHTRSSSLMFSSHLPCLFPVRPLALQHPSDRLSPPPPPLLHLSHLRRLHLHPHLLRHSRFSHQALRSRLALGPDADDVGDRELGEGPPQLRLAHERLRGARLLAVVGERYGRAGEVRSHGRYGLCESSRVLLFHLLLAPGC